MTLTDRKTLMCGMVDAAAEETRLRFLTPGVYQGMTYWEKFSQAKEVIVLGEETANALSEQDRIAQFPTLAASVGLEAETLWDCAELVISRYETFAALSYQIERTRLTAKQNISAASDEAAVMAVARALTWPTPS